MLKKYISLEYIHDIVWEDIFAVWRAHEAYQPSWEKHWIERGFKSWDEWRNEYISPINPQKKEWKIYRIKDFGEVSEFYGVPSKGWIEKCYDGEITQKVSEILDHPIVKGNDKVKSLMENFPYQTMLTGIVSDGRIILVEGMHRALSVAVMTKNGLRVTGDIVIALAEHEGEIPQLGKGALIK